MEQLEAAAAIHRSCFYMSQTRQSGCDSPAEVRANKMQIMKLDSCGSALFLCYLQHLCDTAVMADKKTGGQNVKKTEVVSFASNTKSNISQLSHGLAQHREWLNFAQVGLRGAGCKEEASVQQCITPISMIQSLGHLIFPKCSAFLHWAKDYVPFLPLQETYAKTCQ